MYKGNPVSKFTTYGQGNLGCVLFGPPCTILNLRVIEPLANVYPAMKSIGALICPVSSILCQGTEEGWPTSFVWGPIITILK
jgi:hypothetical protein